MFRAWSLQLFVITPQPHLSLSPELRSSIRNNHASGIDRVGDAAVHQDVTSPYASSSFGDLLRGILRTGTSSGVQIFFKVRACNHPGAHGKKTDGTTFLSPLNAELEFALKSAEKFSGAR
jgi:hypothetical protein